jgi:hypothetical protein
MEDMGFELLRILGFFFYLREEVALGEGLE